MWEGGGETGHKLFIHSINADQFSTWLGIFALLPLPTLSWNKGCGTAHCVRRMVWRDLLSVWLCWQVPCIRSQGRWEWIVFSRVNPMSDCLLGKICWGARGGGGNGQYRGTFCEKLLGGCPTRPYIWQRQRSKADLRQAKSEPVSGGSTSSITYLRKRKNCWATGQL